MAENLALFDFSLFPEDLETIRVMDKGKSLFGWN
jgi:hypothetical protein